ncbi:MAG: DUF3800 domain-containing protein [Terrimicrobiaceae bacterium]|nr:DUF3800 domain-containing protein [Terrimicrobiaceae bacterium]
MLVFIDESGDPGMKLAEGSSLYFTVAMVVFEDHEEAVAADQRIGLLRREWRFAEGFEFHFNKLRGDLREQFLAAVSPYEFLYFGIVINKMKLAGPGFQFRDSFYKYACSLVFENAKPYLDAATVVIDGSGSEKFRQQLVTYLRRRVNDPKSPSRAIRKVKIQDSRRNNLLQLADMVCGALARSYGEKSDAQNYRRIIRHREFSVQFWPK